MRRIMIFILILGTAFSTFAIDTTEILDRVDNNQTSESSKYTGEMIIEISGKEIVKTFYGYFEGEENMFLEFTNSDDEGTKYLKKDGKIYVYTEDLEEIMPITGHMLKESMMGSDMSYEDMSENNDSLANQYNAKIVKETTLNGRPVWVLELNAKRKTVAYPKRMMWVDKEDFIPIKEELFALSGVKLRETIIDDFIKIKGKNFPTKIIFDDLLRKNSKTIFIMKNIELDIKIPSNTFTLRNLER
ncbi:MAG: outer membrane lipoprotein-sorting protein [Spirochaetes bacterium]|nr:outer membrane lipoprotein-sorting protein [Spirochaetota bacterium]